MKAKKTAAAAVFLFLQECAILEKAKERGDDMARAATKKERRLLIKWMFALTAVLAVMIGMALLLRPAEKTTQDLPQQTTAPTVADLEFIRDDNGFLACTTQLSVPGIDVSHHQGTIRWEEVRDAGVEFAIIRLGYRKSKDGTLHEDEQARRNLAQAKAAGLKIGAYLFSQAVNEDEAAQEAAFALEILGDTELDLPLVFDWEQVSDSTRTTDVSAETLMGCVRRFCGDVERAGYKPMVYFNQDLARTRLDLQELEYPFWLAMYSEDLRFDYPVQCWQYTDQGRIPGIDEYVDIDLYFP